MHDGGYGLVEQCEQLSVIHDMYIMSTTCIIRGVSTWTIQCHLEIEKRT